MHRLECSVPLLQWPDAADQCVDFELAGCGESQHGFSDR